MKKLLGIALAVVTVAALGLVAVPAMASGPHDTNSVATENQTSVQAQETVQARIQANNQVRATDANGYGCEYGPGTCDNCPCDEEDRPLDGTGYGATRDSGNGNGYHYEDCPLDESGECPCGQEDRPLDGTGYGATNDSGHGNCYHYDR